MQVRNVQLHGGPMHGKLVAVPAGQNHIHIAGMDDEAMIRAYQREAEDTPVSSVMRRGTYSQVSGYPHDFEWDGWDPRERTH
jgi:hypothetical protein